MKVIIATLILIALVFVTLFAFMKPSACSDSLKIKLSGSEINITHNKCGKDASDIPEQFSYEMVNNNLIEIMHSHLDENKTYRLYVTLAKTELIIYELQLQQLKATKNIESVSVITVTAL